MNFAHFVQKWAQTAPDRPAVAIGNTVVHDYRSLAERVSRIAGSLQTLGLKPGDRVGLLMKNVPEYFECLLACWHAGLAAVPINAKLHARESEFILQDSAAALCFTTRGLSEQASDAGVRVIEIGSAEYLAMAEHSPIELQPTLPTDLGWLFYTSGTTGRPKGAMITHRNMMAASFCYLADVDPTTPHSSILHPAPLSHGSGLYALPHLMKGSCQVVPESAGFEAAEIFSMIQSWPGTVMFAAPTMIRRLTAYEKDVDHSGLKAILYGGAPMLLADIKSYLDRFGPRLAQLYGQGESPMTITAMNSQFYADKQHPKWEARLGSAGIGQSVIELRTVNSSGESVAAGEIGEVICRGDSVIPAYWNNEEATKRALRDGWLWTGDMGSIDEDGFLTLKDRSKDMIISGGENIYSTQVEAAIHQHPAVLESAVFGIPDEVWGEAVKAVVVLKPGTTATAAQIIATAGEHLASYQKPKSVDFVDALPKAPTGKILKRELRDPYWQDADKNV